MEGRVTVLGVRSETGTNLLGASRARTTHSHFRERRRVVAVEHVDWYRMEARIDR